VEDKKVKKEEKDIIIVLKKLNLAVVNNRIFFINDKSKKFSKNLTKLLRI